MLSAEALSFRQQSRLAISLSWIGGFTNVFALQTLGTFASHITGASTWFAFNTASGLWSDAVLFAVIVGSFFGGAISSAFLTETARRHGARSKYTLPLTIEAMLLTALIFALRHADASQGVWRCFLLGLTAYAMGLQNATITKISGAVVRSTHLTGVLTDLGIESVQFGFWAWDLLRGRWWQRSGRILRISQRHPAFLRVALLASIWGSFVFGAFVGALGYQRFHRFTLLAPVIFLLFIVGLDWYKRIAEIREIDPLADPDLKLHGIVHTLLPAELGLYRLAHDPHRHFLSPNFNMWIDRIPATKRVVILVLSPLMKFDASAILDMEHAIAKLEASHKRLLIAGITPAQYKKLAHEHLVERIGASNVCPDLEFAIGLATEIVQEMRKRS
jgi:uncharacterized membrane protein YoaK (UPF0700 family)